jgi:hypothetical protein
VRGTCRVLGDLECSVESFEMPGCAFAGHWGDLFPRLPFSEPPLALPMLIPLLLLESPEPLLHPNSSSYESDTPQKKNSLDLVDPSTRQAALSTVHGNGYNYAEVSQNVTKAC